jgi:hypothetical protein
MEFQAELSHTLDRVPNDLSRLSELIDPAWIEQALQATGKASIRRRKLPAEHVVWLVIGLALLAVDGVVWSAPDTPDNRTELAVPTNTVRVGGLRCAPCA